jgi:hypothetical protein
MALEPIWRATVQSRKNPSMRLASTLAITMPVDCTMRRLTEGVGIRDIMTEKAKSAWNSCNPGIGFLSHKAVHKKSGNDNPFNLLFPELV